jgi:hypothetical protein
MDEGDGGSALNLPSRAPELTATVHDGLDADQHCLRRSEPMHAQGRRWLEEAVKVPLQRLRPGGEK